SLFLGPLPILRRIAPTIASASLKSGFRPARMFLVRVHAPRQQPLRSMGIVQVDLLVFDERLSDGLLQLVILFFAGAIEILVALVGRVRARVIVVFSPRCIAP